MVVLNKALIKNSTATLFVDGMHVATCKVWCSSVAYLSIHTSVDNQLASSLSVCLSGVIKF